MTLSLLTLAIILDDEEFVKTVLNYHDINSINKPDNKGLFAIIYSILYNKNDKTNILELLLKKGADIDRVYKINIGPNKYLHHSIFTLACSQNLPSFNYKTTSFNTHSDSVKSLDFDNSKYQSSNIRVICKNILYLIGIPIEIANEDTLIKKEYLGQYGSIQKIIINKNGYLKNESDYPTYSSYITYSSQIEASLALLALNNSNHLNHKLSACYCTNKYCNSFLKGVECTNKDCYYLHETADQNDIINKNESQTKFQFLEQQKLATKIADIYSPEQKEIYIQKGLDMKQKFQENNIEAPFPTIDTIYEKKFVQDFENEVKGINNNDYYSSNKKYKKVYNYKPSSPNYSKNNKKNIFYSPKSNENKDSLVEEESGEDDEYILVRQPSKHKKKFIGNKTSYRKNIYKKDNYKLKYTLEKYRIKYNIKYEEKNSSFSPNTDAKTSSNSNEAIKSNENELDNDTILSNDKPKLTLSDNCLNKNLSNLSGYNTNESSIQNNQQEDSEKKNYNKISKKSRFSFVNNYTENIEQKNIFNVPDYVEEILNKKIFLLSFTHLIKGQAQHSLEKYYSEEVLLADEIKIIKNWALEK
jgi:CCR4-NOT transcription complex subunit 4